MADGIKKVADLVRNFQPGQKLTKVNRTLSLLEPQYSGFMRYCRSKGISASDVVDQLIAEFLQEVADDIPADADQALDKAK